MQRPFCVKLLSKIPRNGSSTNTNLISPKFVCSSAFLKTNASPFYQQSFSEYFTLSCSHLWKICSPSGVSGRITKGVFSSSVLARRFLSNTLLRGRSKFPVNGTVSIHTRKGFHSFESQYRGWRSIFRRLTTDGVVLGLIMTNVAVFVLWGVAGPQFMVKNFTISIDNFTSGRLHTLITSAFSHRDSWHILSNMFGLYIFGTSIGRVFGPEYLLKLYLSGAVVGSIFYLAYHAFIAPLFQVSFFFYYGHRDYDYQIIFYIIWLRKQMLGIDPSKVAALGASGAVNAIMLLDIFLFPTKTLYYDLVIPVPAILLGIFMIGKDVLRMLQGEKQISGSAHLGGATVAAFAWAQSRRGRFRRF